MYFNKGDLCSGTCSCCEEESNELIMHQNGRCLDCIFEEAFINSTMEGVYTIGSASIFPPEKFQKKFDDTKSP